MHHNSRRRSQTVTGPAGTLQHSSMQCTVTRNGPARELTRATCTLRKHAAHESVASTCSCSACFHEARQLPTGELMPTAPPLKLPFSGRLAIGKGNDLLCRPKRKRSYGSRTLHKGNRQGAACPTSSHKLMLKASCRPRCSPPRLNCLNGPKLSNPMPGEDLSLPPDLFVSTRLLCLLSTLVLVNRHGTTHSTEGKRTEEEHKRTKKEHTTDREPSRIRPHWILMEPGILQNPCPGVPRNPGPTPTSLKAAPILFLSSVDTAAGWACQCETGCWVAGCVRQAAGLLAGLPK